MTLEAGARLGPYQIVAPLGAGGMGEVYRAHDPRLGRDVAVKTLPAGLAATPERRARFEQEARAASALHHPNIITILDVGEDDGVAWIAMELVEGKTLRELLAAGQLATRKSLEIAVQVADALAKAHAAGILHRDLKPDNVMISKDGYVKILDFGLAKLAEPDGGQSSERSTMARPLTGSGVVLGTAGYMSPEQAAGRETDFRSDQFALGAILFEMATGARPFQRPTVAETLAAIIREEPEPIARLNPRAPAPLRWITERCLAKDPDDRFASTRDLARDLASLRDHLSETTSSAEALPAPRGSARWRMPAAIAAVALALGFGLGALAFRRAATDAVEFDQLSYRRGTVLSARFAPDGQSVVYSAAWEGRAPEVFSVRFDSPESRSLGLPAAEVFSVSASGEMALGLNRRYTFGWERQGTLARAPLGGGTAPREMLEGVLAADWAPDGQALAVARDAGEKRRLEFPLGKVLYETAGWIDEVHVSPDGSHVAFVDHPERGDNLGSLVVCDSTGARNPNVRGPAHGERRRLAAGRPRAARLPRQRRRHVGTQAPAHAPAGHPAPARRLERRPHPVEPLDLAPGDRGPTAGCAAGAQPLLAGLVLSRRPLGGRDDAALRGAEHRHPRRQLQDLPAQARRLARRVPRGGSSVWAVARREVGAGGEHERRCQGARGAADRQRPAANDRGWNALRLGLLVPGRAPRPRGRSASRAWQPALRGGRGIRDGPRRHAGGRHRVPLAGTVARRQDRPGPCCRRRSDALSDRRR
jgi:predicted Ser/Thr protein kinase